MLNKTQSPQGKASLNTADSVLTYLTVVSRITLSTGTLVVYTGSSIHTVRLARRYNSKQFKTESAYFKGKRLTSLILSQALYTLRVSKLSRSFFFSYFFSEWRLCFNFYKFSRVLSSCKYYIRLSSTIHEVQKHFKHFQEAYSLIEICLSAYAVKKVKGLLVW